MQRGPTVKRAARTHPSLTLESVCSAVSSRYFSLFSSLTRQAPISQRISVLIVRLFSLLSRRHSCSFSLTSHSSSALALEEDEDEEKEGVVWLNLGDTPTAQRTPGRA